VNDPVTGTACTGTCTLHTDSQKPEVTIYVYFFLVNFVNADVC